MKLLLQKDIEHLYKLGAGFQQSLLLFEALRLGIFTQLGKKSVTLREIGRAKKIPDAALARILNALIAIGLVRQEGNCYMNTAAAKQYLMVGSPQYLGDIFIHQETLMQPWYKLHRCLHKGTMITPSRAVLHDYPRQLKRYLNAMHALGVIKAPLIYSRALLKDYSRMLDIGGGKGSYAVSFARRNKKLKATVVDLKTVVPYARRYVKESGLNNRISVVAGECLSDPLPEGAYDLIFISNLLHMYSASAAQMLINKAVAALNGGGTVMIHDYITGIGDPVIVSLCDMTMLAGTPEGRCHEKNETVRWMKAAGLQKVRSAEVCAGTSIVWGNLG